MSNVDKKFSRPTKKTEDSRLDEEKTKKKTHKNFILRKGVPDIV